ncbi:MAG: NAD-dependent DNA ligase LigA [Spirochaetota bacterium]
MSKLELKIRKLEKEIRYHQYLYYVKNRTEISDKEFDLLFKQLQELERDNPDLSSPNSPTQSVGSDLDNRFEKVTHKVPVLSLENTYNAGELQDWIDKIGKEETYSIEWKIDGASIVLYYEAGGLDKGVSRGTGGIGDDVTENIRTIKNISLQLDDSISIYLRGEVYMTFSDFAQLNKQTGGKYANPRNLASGTLKHKNSKQVAKRPLKIFTYDAYFPKEPEGIDTHQKLIDYMKKYGFPIPNDIKFVKGSEVISLIKEYEKKKEKLGFPVDGLVIKLNNLSLRKSLGQTSHSPRWARAYKFDALTVESVVEEIDFAIGRTGKVTPRAKITPVQLAGTTVTYATLHNQDYINSKGIGIGAKVKVVKRGEIIPAIEEVVKKGKKVFRLPKKCPMCSSILQKKDDSVDLYCTNPTCPGREKNQLAFFCQKKQMDIAGLGEKQVYNLYDLKFIKRIPDIYHLSQYKDDLIQLDGYGEKSVKILLDGIEKSKKNDLKVILPSLGLPEIGHKVTEILIDNGFTDIKSLLQLASSSDAKEKLMLLHGLGPKTIDSVVQNFTDKNVIGMIQELQKVGLQFKAKVVKKQGKQVFSGQTWCVTGSFQKFQPRERAMEIIVAHGGKRVSGISSNTTHLLAGTGSGSKLKKAEEYGVKIMEESEFYSFIVKEGLL